MAKKNTKRAPATLINRRAEHEYFFINRYEAGVKLYGSEVKAIRAGNANLTEAYCIFKDNELFVRGLHVSEYQTGGDNNIYDSKRLRKLLLHRSELVKLQRALIEKGKTIIPYRLYFTDRGFAKIEICLATGKKDYDKRETIKQRDNKRELDQVKKQFNLKT